ncbi:N-acetylneuraminate lyase-like [Spodoptera litura]|uniref:N-acetylneuraminate lyase n=1 Tax=Spodoptera litura TaxID=69820 RepID=A0A9J7IL52_SPOLT|nr:N-acetylneuraminate lyase-like [Spodoptera litura]
MGAVCVFFLIIATLAFSPTSEAIEPKCFEVKGILAPVFTPIYEDGSLRLDIVPQYAQYLKDKGVDGVVVASAAGEGPNLNTSENKLLLDAWMEAVRPLDLFIVSGVGAEPFPKTLEIAAYSEEIGVDAILAYPQVYYKPQSVDDLVYYMELVAKSAPKTPLLYDDLPGYTGVHVNIVEFIEKMTQKIPTFKGLRSNDINDLLLLRSRLIDDQKLYAANDFYLGTEALLDYDNYLMPIVNIFPRLVEDIVKHGKDGNRFRTLDQYDKLAELAEIIDVRDNWIAGLKEAMRLVTGINVGPAKPPQRPLSEEQKYRMANQLRYRGVDVYA